MANYVGYARSNYFKVKDNEMPKIYVASLSDYNAGRLIGTHIDLDVDVDEAQEQIDEMLKGSYTRYAEEWAIHDYDNCGVYTFGESQPLDSVIAIGNKACEFSDNDQRDAFWAWASNEDNIDDAERLSKFDDEYIATAASRDEIDSIIMEHYIENQLHGLTEDSPFLAWIDFEKFEAAQHTSHWIKGSGYKFHWFYK